MNKYRITKLGIQQHPEGTIVYYKDVEAEIERLREALKEYHGMFKHKLGECETITCRGYTQKVNYNYCYICKPIVNAREALKGGSAKLNNRTCKTCHWIDGYDCIYVHEENAAMFTPKLSLGIDNIDTHYCAEWKGCVKENEI